MLKYVLICCYERDIETPRFFKTKEEAFDAMLNDVADYIGFSHEEMKNEFANGIREFDNSTYVDADVAWSDRHANCDWRIFEIKEVE